MTADLTFGAWLRRCRRQLDLTQQELADRSSCSVATIRKIEQANRRPSKQLAELMAAALQAPAEQVTDFVTYARQDPDSTLMPPALLGFGQATAQSAADSGPAQTIHPQQAADAGASVLPRPTTPFLGREAEIEELLTYLQDPVQQLVCILGPGGMGKTRLALAVADRLAARDDHPFADGIVFVSLAALTEPDQIAPAIADGLAMIVDGRRSTAEQLLAYLAQRRSLLIIDNCEHLLDGIGLLVDIVQAAPGVTVLATSRERLHLQGEQAYPIDGLGALDPIDLGSDAATDHPAVRLFMQSALRAAPTFALTTDDLLHVARVCRLVAGMPLGIELSAGWVGMMSLAEIADEVQQNLDFLASDFRDLPARHRSMRAVFDASWRHLDPVEQLVFRQLSVFRGGFTRQAAADVTGATLRHLGHLIYKSLLHYDRERNRYWLHELLYQYGSDRLAEDAAEASAASASHCDYFVKRLIACSDLLKGEDQAGALAELDEDIDNFRLAWRTAIAMGEVTRLRPAMDTLGFYFEWRFHPGEGRVAFQRLADVIDPTESDEARLTLVRALAWQASFLRQTGKQDAALDLLDRADVLCDLPAIDEKRRRFEQAFIAYQRGYCLEQRDNERALDYFHKSVALWEAHDDPWWTALALRGLGDNLHWANRFVEAREQLSKSVEIFEHYGHTRELVFLHNRLCACCKFKGDLGGALYHGQLALTLAKQSGNRKSLADALYMLSSVKLQAENRLKEAETLNDEALTIYRSLGVDIHAALSTASDGDYRLIRGDIEGANRRFAEAREIFLGLQLRQGDGYTLRWLAIAAQMDGRGAEASQMIDRSIKIFEEIGSYNYVPHLHVIRYLIEKKKQPPAKARPQLVEILRDAVKSREYYDVYWSSCPRCLTPCWSTRRQWRVIHCPNPLPWPQRFAALSVKVWSTAGRPTCVPWSMMRWMRCWPDGRSRRSKPHRNEVGNKKCGRLRCVSWSRWMLNVNRVERRASNRRLLDHCMLLWHINCKYAV